MNVPARTNHPLMAEAFAVCDRAAGELERLGAYYAESTGDYEGAGNVLSFARWLRGVGEDLPVVPVHVIEDMET